MKKIRGSLALLLAAALLWGSAAPGRAAELTEATEETTSPETSATEETILPPETTVPGATLPQETAAPGTTLPQETAVPETTAPPETQPSAYEALYARMEALAAEAQHLSPELAVLDDFSGRLRGVWNEACDAWDRGELSDGELAVLDDLGWSILAYLESEYRYEDGVISPLAIERYGSQERPVAATSENSVASLGNGSGIKFRIFNYTNGLDTAGNYIFSGGINDNGLSGYFDFRGTSYENTGSDGKVVCSVTNSVTDVDGYTASHATVLPNLGSDGYPVFDGSRDSGPQKSLGYLFGAGGKGVTAYSPGNTLLRLNSRGQYYYDSAENAVDFDVEANRFIVRTYRERGKTTAGMGSGQYYDFFPFTYWNGTTKEQSDTANWYNYNNTEEVDYWFGMTMEATFSMPEGGLVQQEPMVFEFSGDDDVWVFIDGVLVLDLGGTHGVVSGSINFATGEVKQYLDWNGAGESSAGTSFPTTLKARFDAAGKTPKGGWNGDVFADYTEHTVKFYYLERATSCANCKILFNMPILPTGLLTVEKQLSGPGTNLTAEDSYGFSLMQITDSGESPGANLPFDRIDVSTGAVLGTGTTDAEGRFLLKAGQRAEFALTAGKTFLVRESDPGANAEAVGCTLNGLPQTLEGETDPVSVDPDSPAAAVFTNRLKTLSLSVRKLVAGNMGDRDREFAFRAGLYSADPAAGGIPIPFSNGRTEAVFRLKHGQTDLLEGIPVGAWLRLSEENAGDYETLWQWDGGNGTGREATLGPLTAPAELEFTNTREVLIDTGVRLDTAPYLLMTAAGTLPLLRRKRRRQ